MSDAPSIPPVSPDPRVTRAQPAQAPGRAGDARAASETGPAFQALLERLEARAAELEARSKSLVRAEELPEAVDAARAGLADALELGAELLEAFRAAEQRGDEA